MQHLEVGLVEEFLDGVGGVSSQALGLHLSSSGHRGVGEWRLVLEVEVESDDKRRNDVEDELAHCFADGSVSLEEREGVQSDVVQSFPEVAVCDEFLEDFVEGGTDPLQLRRIRIGVVIAQALTKFLRELNKPFLSLVGFHPCLFLYLHFIDLLARTAADHPIDNPHQEAFQLQL